MKEESKHERSKKLGKRVCKKSNQELSKVRKKKWQGPSQGSMEGR